MLQITPYQAVLNGFMYDLSPQQTHAIETQLQGMGVPSHPWGYTHWSEAAACQRLTEAGYDLVSPTQRGLAESAANRDAPINEREATSPTTPRDLAAELEAMTQERDDAVLELADVQDALAEAQGKQVQP